MPTETPLPPPGAAPTVPASPPRPDIDQDLGFGSVVARESRQRLLNPDGTFNVRREGLGPIARLAPYHSLLVMPWPAFLGYAAALYVLVNALFAVAYVLCGPGALGDHEHTLDGSPLVRAFFFSVHTFATIGYGAVVPVGVGANAIVTVESFLGILTVALLTGLVFARFSRPTARLRFSRRAVMAPYQGGMAFMFRLVNERKVELVQLEARVMYSYMAQGANGQLTRKFVDLALERQRVVFFPLAWTIVHPIDERSPLWGVDQAAMEAQEAEFLVLMSGTDETSSQVVHARTSYKPRQVQCAARFIPIFNPPHPDGTLSIDIRRLDEVEPV